MEEFIEAIPDLAQQPEEAALSPANRSGVRYLGRHLHLSTLAMIQDPYRCAAGGRRALFEQSPLWLIWEQFVNDLCTERTLQ